MPVIINASTTSGIGITSDTSGVVQFQSAGANTVQISASGEVLIAGITDQGAYNLQVAGTGVWAAGAYTNGSDERIKDNIQPIGPSLDVVTQLNPITFQYKSDWSTDQSVQPGFIAQELLTALQNTDYANGVVSQGTEYYSVAYQALIPVLTKAIQEMNASFTQALAEANSKIDALTTRIEALENA